ncbi:MAG TPA: YjgP/YjgQ family permease [Thermosulfurimonas dismutans]|uniref:YjgP/YjgQ family permease n=1 Tax=Thermosulfurimonas dismutans TaxID=999894 RepID=A0A7C3GH21_9BACT|nr:YjgP/YjgQ family permease [Thermosulfurimonas dismutans]
MKLYQRYLLSPLKLLLPLILTALGGIYFLVEFFERLEDILVARAPVGLFLVYLFYRLPEILYQIWPPSLALALLSCLAFVSRGNELLALRTLGFSSGKILRPYLGVALLLSFLFSGFLALTLPRASYQALYTWEVRIKGEQPWRLLASGKMFFIGPDFLLSARPLEPRGELLEDLFYIRRDRAGPRAYVYARQARYLKGGKWLLERGVEAKRKENFLPHTFSRRIFSISFSPRVLLSVQQPLNTLSLRDLWRRYRFLKASGLSASLPLTEILYRLLFPFISLLVAAPALVLFLTFRGKRALAKGLSAGILAVILSYTWFMVLKALAAGGKGSPFLLLPAGLVFPAIFAILVGRRYAY